MEDIAPELLARIEQEFEERFKADSILAELAAKLGAGAASHTQAYEYAGRVGEILTDAYQHHIASSSLPDGRLWYNIADRVITPTMKRNYDLIAQYVTAVQTDLNQAAGIGIKALPPDMDVEEKIQGIVNRVSSEKLYDDVRWILKEPVKTFGRTVVDTSIKANAEFQGRSGLTPKIIRKTSGSCCKWCTSLAGTYTYPDVPKDVYRRHDNCRCTVNYDSGGGKVKNIHSGKEGKRRYVRNEYGGYTKTKEDRIAQAKRMAVAEEARKAAAREKRIANLGKKNDNIALNKLSDVTDEYKKRIGLSTGNLTIEDGYTTKDHEKEVNIARLIANMFGGDITVLKEINEDKVSTPDYIWNGKYWELKSPSCASLNAIDKRLQKGLHQIEKNPGGVILNLENTQVDINSIATKIENRLTRHSDNNIGCDVIVLIDGELKLVIRK